MDMQVRSSTYKDQPAVTVESEQVSAQLLPGIGAKLASLVYKPLGLELLVQRPNPKYLLQPYDGDYVAGECSGFDDMFPTIDACHYPRYPWKGTPIPDHGEVWSLPWQMGAQGETLTGITQNAKTEAPVHFVTHGVRFPYRLEKWVAFTEPAVLRLAYRLTNLSPFDFDYLWAAHTMFILEEGARLVLPSGVRQVVSRISLGGNLGAYGDIFDWPRHTTADGQVVDLSVMRPPSVRDAVKYFVKGRMPEGWCALTYPRSGFTLGLRFPVEQVPYLGILTNEGGWQDLYNIFLEPGTGSFDDLNAARVRGECSTLPGQATHQWHLDISLTADAEWKA